MSMTVAVTGHRPNKLNYEYNGEGEVSSWIKERIKQKLYTIEADTCISGMALGVDMLFAECAIDLKLDLIAAIPCRNQEKVWPQLSQNRYNQILNYDRCQKVLVNDVEYQPWVMQKRNEWMVDNCNVLLAVWDGSSGGTKNCIDYAHKVNKSILHIDLSKIQSELNI